MAKPKLALIPSGVADDKVFSVLPSNGDGDFDFTRGSTATRVNAQGLIETVSNDLPRLNYPLLDGKVVGCPSLLLEDSATNLVTYSEDFSNSAWEYGGIIKTPNNAISPDGTLNAEKIEITTLSTPNLRQTILVLPSTKYTFSFYAKSEELSNLKLAIYDLSNASFILENEEKLINSQWSRVSVTFTTPSGCTSIRAFVFRNSDLLGSFYVWGSQLESGSFISSYIPNLGIGTTTRLAETCNGAGTSDTFNDSEGVLMAEISALDDDLNIEAISINANNADNRLALFKWNVSNRFQIRVNIAGNTPIDAGVSVSNIKDLNKISLKYKSGDYALWINGFEVYTNSLADTPIGLSNLSFDSNGSAGVPFRGNTKQLQYFDTALTDSELETLTSWVSFQEMAEGQLYSVE